MLRRAAPGEQLATQRSAWSAPVRNGEGSGGSLRAGTDANRPARLSANRPASLSAVCMADIPGNHGAAAERPEGVDKLLPSYGLLYTFYAQ